jgi:hypothetical protein
VFETVVAVDWSGAKRTSKGIGPKGIWIAAVHDGALVESRPARSREDAVEYVQSCRGSVLAGFDFSFGLPEWFAREQGCTGIDEVWALAERDGESWLAPIPVAPFWRTRCDVPPHQRLRDCESRNPPAKSVFQLTGAGQVGPGSVRGMPHLGRLRAAGFAVWPFDDAGARTVIEIYPTMLRKIAADVDIGPWTSDDERDAVVSAHALWRGREAAAALVAAADPRVRLEGDLWTPPAPAPSLTVSP